MNGAQRFEENYMFTEINKYLPGLSAFMSISGENHESFKN